MVSTLSIVSSASTVSIVEDRFQNAVNNQIWVTANGRSKVRVRGRCQRKVAFVFFRVARLFQRAQHQVGKNALLRLTRDLLRKLLVHARRDVYLFGNLVLPRIPSAPVAFATLAARLKSPHRQRHTERISESGGQQLEVVDLLRVGLLVNAVQRSDIMTLEISGDAFICGEHELFDNAVRELPLRARDSAHQSS